MRYNSVDDAIADYKKAYGLMWDTRSIIVKFRRKEGNSYLPEELKLDVKKIKEESNNITQVKREQNMNHIEFNVLSESNVNKSKDEENNISQENKINHDKSSANQDTNNMEAQLQDNSIKAQNKSISQIEENTNSHSSSIPTSIIINHKTIQEQQFWVINIKSISILLCYINNIMLYIVIMNLKQISLKNRMFLKITKICSFQSISLSL